MTFGLESRGGSKAMRLLAPVYYSPSSTGSESTTASSAAKPAAQGVSTVRRYNLEGSHIGVAFHVEDSKPGSLLA